MHGQCTMVPAGTFNTSRPTYTIYIYIYICISTDMAIDQPAGIIILYFIYIIRFVDRTYLFQ